MHHFVVPALLGLTVLAVACSDVDHPFEPTARQMPNLLADQDDQGEDNDDQGADLTCYLVTFEGGGQLIKIYPDTDGLVPGTPIRFPLTDRWVTLISGPFANNPSGTTIALWLLGEDAEVLFERPVSRVSFFSATDVPITVDAFNPGGVVVASTTLAANTTSEGFTQWDLVALDVGEKPIARVRITGVSGAVAIDDFEACARDDDGDDRD